MINTAPPTSNSVHGRENASSVIILACTTAFVFALEVTLPGKPKIHPDVITG